MEITSKETITIGGKGYVNKTIDIEKPTGYKLFSCTPKVNDWKGGLVIGIVDVRSTSIIYNAINQDGISQSCTPKFLIQWIKE